MNEIVRLGVVGLQRAIAGGQLRAADAVAAYFDRIGWYNPDLNAYVALDRERALADAAAARTGDEARPLEGVPLAIKANIDVAGLATTAGIGALREAVAHDDAEVVGRLRDAGAIILGHVNMHEAALGATTNNAHFGATHNPWRRGYTAGGSSGGSGAAVAAGLCAAALGTDTLGSIRIPAAYDGVYGLKPTNGLVSDHGLVPLSKRLDAIGPLTRSLADAAALMDVLAPLSPAEAVAKVATLEIVKRTEMAGDVRRAYQLAVDLLAGVGVAVQDYATDGLDLARVRGAAFIAAAREARNYFDSILFSNRNGFSEELQKLFEFASRFDEGAISAGDSVLASTSATLHSILADAEAIILPGTPQTAFPLSDPAPLTQADFTCLANVAGLPAISIPAGLATNGLPVAVQIVGRKGGERTIIDLAGRLDAVLKGYAFPPGFD